jgi:integrase
MVSLWRRFVTCLRKVSAPLVVRRGCPIIFPYRTRFGRRSDAVGKAGKFDPEGSWTPPEGARGGTLQTAEASENAARGSTAAPLAPVGVGLRSAAPQPPGPSDPKGRSFPDPGNRAEGSANGASGSAAAGAPSPAPPEFAGTAAAGTPAKLGPIASFGPAPHAWGPRRAQVPEDRRDDAAPPSAPALPAPVGAESSPAPPDAGAPSDPKRGPHAGVRGAAEDRKPEEVAPQPHAGGANPPALPPPGSGLSGRLASLAETAKAYARSAQADNTRRAYEADWKMFASWLRRQGLSETPPDPEAVGLYLAAQVERGGAELSVATLERRLSGIAWRYRQLGQPLDIRDRHIATVLAGIRRRHGRPPLQKAAIFADELLAMLATLDMSLRGLRDRAILAIGFAGGLRRSEIVGLDCGSGQSEDGSGWVELLPEGALLTIRGKTGWREVEIGRGSRPDTCPVALLETWLRLGRIGHGPLFRAIARKNGGVSGERLTDKHVVRLVKTCALAAGLRGDLAEGERRLAFGGHSLRAGLASSAQIEEAHVQKHLGHASAEMTRRYQRKRDRFTINLTKAAGL